MKIIITIVSLIALLLLLLSFALGFLLGVRRKKKESVILEQDRQRQKSDQETILRRLAQLLPFSSEEKKESTEYEASIAKKSQKDKRKKRRKELRLLIQQSRFVRYWKVYFLSYLGVGILLTGIVFFLRSGYLSVYITPAGKLSLALLMVLLLLIPSYFLRSKHKIFSAILLAGGMGLLYLSFAAAYYLFGLFSEPEVLLIFLIITGICIFLTHLYERFELLMLVLVIAFGVPAFVSLDYRNGVFLLLYLELLLIGTLLMVAKFRNYILRLFPSAASGVYFFWLLQSCLKNNYLPDFPIYFWLLQLLYFTLILVNILYNFKHRVSFRPYEIMMVIGVNIVYYTVGMYLLNSLNPAYKGVFTASTALLNMLFLISSLLLPRRASGQIIYIFMILSIMFLTLIPPVELVGKSIIMIWAVETVLLMWASMKLEIKMMRYISFFLIIGLVTVFFIDLSESYFLILSAYVPEKRSFLNKSFISGMMAAFGLGLNVLLISKSDEEYLFKPLKMRHLKLIISVLALAILYSSGYTEVLYQVSCTVKDNHLISMYMGIYNYLFLTLSILILWLVRLKKAEGVIAFIAAAASIGFFAYYLYLIPLIREHLLLELTITYTQFNSHLFIIGMLLVILLISFHTLHKSKWLPERPLLWSVVLIIIAVLSTELDHYFIIYDKKELPGETVLAKVHYFYYTLFWEASALVLSVIARLFKKKTLLNIAVFLLIISLGKLFIFDIHHGTSMQNIIEFIASGSIALGIAFAGQKLYTENIKAPRVD
ncbi:MAG: hypothetical protein CSB06_03275 [Bacteroidia bacterium]|nr:MAG: hypothetical protein CSB06_03275 [Bacteroidia bacterium]